MKKNNQTLLKETKLKEQFLIFNSEKYINPKNCK